MWKISSKRNLPSSRAANVEAKDIYSGKADVSLRGESLDLPQCQGEMHIITFLTDDGVVDRIINHLKLTFVAEKPPPAHIAYQEVLMAAESSAGYLS